jgi:hypothetical protein
MVEGRRGRATGRERNEAGGEEREQQHNQTVIARGLRVMNGLCACVCLCGVVWWFCSSGVRGVRID